MEGHLEQLPERIDRSIEAAHEQRLKYREELLASDSDLASKIKRPSDEARRQAETILTDGSIAAADGTLSSVPLVGGAKIQVGVVIVANSGDVVDLVTHVFEHDLTTNASSGTDYFSQIRKARNVSNLLSRAVMLYGERRLLLDYKADWRMVHGELVPYELRTGAGRPEINLPPAFDLVHEYIASEQFLAVSEGPEDLDILNAAILLDPGEYIQIRTLEDSLKVFLEGDPETGKQRANFGQNDERRFREFIKNAGPQVAVVLVRAGRRPFLIECHVNRVDEAVALFLTDSLWTRGLPEDSANTVVRGFPFHLDLADRVAGTLFKAGDFQRLVEARLMGLGIEEGLFDLDPRRTRG